MSEQVTRKSKWQTVIQFLGLRRNEVPVLDEAAQELVDNARAFDHLRIEDIMVPRADIKAVDVAIDFAALGKAFVAAAHSRLPVYRGNLDDPIGMVHIKDLLPVVLLQQKKPSQEPSVNLQSIAREVLFVPPSMNADDLLVRMQKTRVHMALVVDEYGGTDGLVTLEDLIEQIVGNIEDEHDTETVILRKISPDCWEADARVPIEELEAATGVRFFGTEEEVETLGGLVFTLSGRVPIAGEVLTHSSGFEFEVIRAEPRRILALKIRRTPVSQSKAVS